VYSNIERQLGKLAKVTAFLEYKQNFIAAAICLCLQAVGPARVQTSFSGARRWSAEGRKSAFARAKSGKAAFAASPGAVK
jgi:hypothetical protein